MGPRDFLEFKDDMILAISSVVVGFKKKEFCCLFFKKLKNDFLDFGIFSASLGPIFTKKLLKEFATSIGSFISSLPFPRVMGFDMDFLEVCMICLIYKK